ncbi:MAG: trehalose synthase [Thermoleophilia bacterium]|nr:trehalose synthase [Thermoleophilia bacterium]
MLESLSALRTFGTAVARDVAPEIGAGGGAGRLLSSIKVSPGAELPTLASNQVLVHECGVGHTLQTWSHAMDGVTAVTRGKPPTLGLPEGITRDAAGVLRDAEGRVSNGMPRDPLWHQKASIMEIDTRAFRDANGDGHGDFSGITEKLDHVESLGVDAIWIKPHYPSGGKDGGYDITDFKAVDPRFGSMADFESFVAESHKRGIRVITELVANHTSIKHPWFGEDLALLQKTRATGGEAAVQRLVDDNATKYVWNFSTTKEQGPPKLFEDTRVIFQDFEPSNWTWNDDAKGWYWHRFFKEQPDLNYDNPAIRKEMEGVLDFWADKGVDGFRLDAVPYLFEREGTWAHNGLPFQGENLDETHQFLKDLRSSMESKYSDRIFLGEANMPKRETLEYFGGDGVGGGVNDEVHLGFGFVNMPARWRSHWDRDKTHIANAILETRDLPDGAAWANFIRNHDELTLEKIAKEFDDRVPEGERERLWSLFRDGSPAHGIRPDPEAPINLGLKLRAADAVGHHDDPALNKAAQRMHLAMLLSEGGSPVLYQGDEIGLTKAHGLFDRDGLRTPMVWDDTVNGGFSAAHPDRVREMGVPVHDAKEAARLVSVAAQEADPTSVLNRTRELLSVRKSIPELQTGRPDVLETGHQSVLAIERATKDSTVVAVTNLSPERVTSTVDLSRYGGRQAEHLFSTDGTKVEGALPTEVELEPYGVRWFRIGADGIAEPVAASAGGSGTAGAEQASHAVRDGVLSFGGGAAVGAGGAALLGRGQSAD